MTTQSADSNGVRIAYEELGGSGGDPILLVMGLGTSRFWWPDGLMDEFVRRGFHVAAYDQRDAGESAHFPNDRDGSPLKTLLRRSPPAYRAEDLADDAAVVLDALGWRRAHVFGHSMGGLVAQRSAIRHPDRILSLTTSSAVPSDAKGIRLLRYVQLGTVRSFTRLRFPETHQGNIDLAMAVVRLLAAPGQAIEESDVKACVEKEAEHNVASFRDDQAQSRQIGAKWSGGRLNQITAPTLVLHGEGDPLLEGTGGAGRRRRHPRLQAPHLPRRRPLLVPRELVCLRHGRPRTGRPSRWRVDGCRRSTAEKNLSSVEQSVRMSATNWSRR